MILTGECKEEFEKWFNRIGSKEYDFFVSIKSKESSLEPIDWFNKMPLSMRYGVYVDFFSQDEIKPNNMSRFNIIEKLNINFKQHDDPNI